MNQFEELSRPRSKPTLLADLKYFLQHSKKWWMLPLIMLLVMFGGLMLLSGTAAAPFIYTLF
jgi:hypothetical protein